MSYLLCEKSKMKSEKLRYKRNEAEIRRDRRSLNFAFCILHFALALCASFLALIIAHGEPYDVAVADYALGAVGF